jgi:hypothetical protein
VLPSSAAAQVATFAQATVTPVTGPAPIVPVPPVTTQLCAGDDGWVATVTA